MLRDIYEYSYVPTICIRPSEMRALQELPEQDKDRLFPLVLLAPWVGANSLGKAIERVKKSYGNRAFFLGIDEYYQIRNDANPASQQFEAIRQGINGFERYYEFIEEFRECIPVVNVGTSDTNCLRRQIERAEELGRGFLLSINNFNTPIGNDRFAIIEAIDHGNFAFHIDKGWHLNPLVEEVWYQGICQSIFQIRERAALVISAASFPKDFTPFEGIQRVDIGPRKLFRAISNRFNNERIIYGDWASTKPRSYQIASTPLPRIDYALRDSWIVARNKTNDWDFQTAAERLIVSEHWIDDINVWGTYMIRETADGLPFSINSAQMASAARINIHLHMQANYNAPDMVLNTDDPWEDI
ncbi:Hypothetical protein NGAL_HAMBI2605_08410 [Neorhizobium galegae bv. orientalis]|nr:Hypothetical protein NGAL_HAMBI2605_08410 [Neorhizobium galegae bv. orientalis]